MSRQDPRGYYDILNVRPDASPEQIELAYALLKKSYQERRRAVDIARVQAAYETLRDVDRRRAYDGVRSRSSARQRTRLSKTRVLLVLVGIFVVVTLTIHGPSWKADLTRFSPGEALALAETGEPFGTVLRFEARHMFGNRAVASAYLISPADGREKVWYPARDLTRICVR